MVLMDNVISEIMVVVIVMNFVSGVVFIDSLFVLDYKVWLSVGLIRCGNRY